MVVWNKKVELFKYVEFILDDLKIENLFILRYFKI